MKFKAAPRNWVPRSVLLAATLGLALAGAAPCLHAAEQAGCLEPALALLKSQSPAQVKVYEKLADPKFFAFWLDCNDPTYGLDSAVHESTHKINSKESTSKRYSYYLPAGDSLAVPRLKLFNRDEIGALLAPEDKNTYYQTYLTGASGRQDLHVLLDELNAYTHDLLTSFNLYKLIPSNTSVSARDGVANMMYFTLLYLKRAREAHAEQWKTLSASAEHRALLRTLWSNAEQALRMTCSIDSLGINDGPALKKTYAKELLDELSRVFQQAAEKFDPQGVGQCGSFRSEAPAGDDSKEEPTTTTVKRLQLGSVHITVDGRELTADEIEQRRKSDPEFAAWLESVSD